MNTWKWFVYIIECKDGTYYTGRTWNLHRRWQQHLSGFGSKYTARHRPKQIVYYEIFKKFDDARRREKQLKGWSQAKKKKLISGEWKKI